ncbi:hypothetical protein [Nonomuraea candida]|uniref:hypothetical protein n=1 Tax=Nonomuraea candida TaxID=359159 RepID=UPI0012F756F3|nr:hypothetical protein [Nonomuraea candida]
MCEHVFDNHLPEWSACAPLKLATLAITRRVDLSAYPCPSTLAQAYERVWAGYGCGQAGEGGVVALETWRPTPALVPVESGTTQPPLVAVAGRTLAVGEPGAGPASIRVYDVDTTPATRLGEIRALTVDGLPDLVRMEAVAVSRGTASAAGGAAARPGDPGGGRPAES